MNGKKANEEARNKVFEYCETLGFWNVHPVSVAEKLGVPHQNVCRWKQQYIDKYGIPDIEQYGKELSMNSWNGLKGIMALTKTEDKKLRLEAIRTLIQCTLQYSQFLETFGYKKKVPDELNIKTQEVTFQERYKVLMEKRKNANKAGNSGSGNS